MLENPPLQETVKKIEQPSKKEKKVNTIFLPKGTIYFSGPYNESPEPEIWGEFTKDTNFKVYYSEHDGPNFSIYGKDEDDNLKQMVWVISFRSEAGQKKLKWRDWWM